jgi:hypothetical protein
MQPDPIGYAAGMNAYAYVRADPINLADPSGLQPPPDPNSDCGRDDNPCTDTVIGKREKEPSEDLVGWPTQGYIIRATSMFGFGPQQSESEQQCPSVPNPGLGRQELNRRVNAAAARAEIRKRDFFSIPALDNRLELFWKSFPGSTNDTKSYLRGSAEYGNFLFGAEAAASGLSQEEALSWGASAQFVQDLTRLTVPNGRDRPEDISAIKAGYKYYKNGCSRR